MKSRTTYCLVDHIIWSTGLLPIPVDFPQILLINPYPSSSRNKICQHHILIAKTVKNYEGSKTLCYLEADKFPGTDSWMLIEAIRLLSKRQRNLLLTAIAMSRVSAFSNAISEPKLPQKNAKGDR